MAPGPSLMAHVGVGSPGMGPPQPAIRFTVIFFLSYSVSVESCSFYLVSGILFRINTGLSPIMPHTCIYLMQLLIF